MPTVTVTVTYNVNDNGNNNNVTYKDNNINDNAYIVPGNDNYNV